MIKLSHPFFKTGLPLIGATVAGWLVLSATLERRIQRKVHINPTRPTITSFITIPLNKFDISKTDLTSLPLSFATITSQEARQAVPESDKARSYDPELELEVSNSSPHSQYHPKIIIYTISTHSPIFSPLTSLLQLSSEDSKGSIRDQLRE